MMFEHLLDVKKQVYFGAHSYIVLNTSSPSPHSKTAVCMAKAKNSYNFTLNYLKYSRAVLTGEVD